MNAEVESAVCGYYGSALATHGPTPRGVDWPTEESQVLRFDTLLGGVDWAGRTSLLDFGCGCGALAAHLDRRGIACDYVGYDISSAMIDAARTCYPGRRFTRDPEELAPADHVLASGIFNVKLETADTVWRRHVEDTLAVLSSLARRRLAFNMLPPAVPADRARADLHYADPAEIVAYVRGLGRDVAVRENYGLWEFTVIAT